MKENKSYQLDDQARASLRSECQGNLYVFIKGVLGYKDMVQGVHLPLCKLLERMVPGSPDWVQHLLCVIPRGWFKTTVVSIGYPLWRACKNPDVRILLVQNTFTNAEAKLRAISQHIKGNVLLRSLFPEILPGKQETWKSSSMCLRRSGNYPESTFECAGTSSDLVSRHYDVIIQDDTVAPSLDEMGEDNLLPTKGDIDQAIGFHKLALPLLVNPGESQMLVVGTRWFEWDLIQFIKDKEPSYHVYERACKETGSKPDPQGTLTFPERFSEKVLQQIEAKMGPYLYSCLYLNQPLRSKDMVFRPEWVVYYDTPPARMDVFVTVDSAGDPEESKGEPDANVVMVVGRCRKTRTLYVLDYSHERQNVGELIETVFRMVEKWKPEVVGVECIAYQKTLKYWMRKRMVELGVFFLIEEVNGGGKSKNLRISGLQPLVANRHLVFRTWMTALISELMIFPLGKNDDLADALAMMLELVQVLKPGEDQRDSTDPDPQSLEELLSDIRLRNRGGSDGVVFDAYTGALELSNLN